MSKLVALVVLSRNRTVPPTKARSADQTERVSAQLRRALTQHGSKTIFPQHLERRVVPWRESLSSPDASLSFLTRSLQRAASSGTSQRFPVLETFILWPGVRHCRRKSVWSKQAVGTLRVELSRPQNRCPGPSWFRAMLDDA